jgi:hypothetical protein
VAIGDVKPKSTPADILEKLEKGVFKDWKSKDGDKRCPICLDDDLRSERLRTFKIGLVRMVSVKFASRD